MSPEQIIQQQIAAEINLIPEAKRQELYELIHNFRINLKEPESTNRASQIMDFAGSWSDIPEEDFNDFYIDIEQRRQNSRSRRDEL